MIALLMLFPSALAAEPCDAVLYLCLRKLIDTPQAELRKAIGYPCNTDFECIERWLETWQKACIDENYSDSCRGQ